MKNILLPSLLLASVLGASTLSAQTTWTGADGASLTTAGNWSSGVPTLLSTGTIPNTTLGINFNASVTNWVVIQNGGNVTAATINRTFNGGSWTMNGGSMSIPSNFQLVTTDNQNHTFTVNSTASVSSGGAIVVSSVGSNRTATLNINGGSVSSSGTLLGSGGLGVQNGGTVNFTSGNLSTTGGTLTVVAGGNFSMSGGTRTGREVSNSGTLLISGGNFSTDANRNITTLTGGVTTISGGIVSIGNTTATSITGNGSYVFNGGTTTATGTITPTAGFTVTLGGTSVGSLTATNWGGTEANRNTNWLTGTKMTMTLSGGAANWAETEWAAGRMFYNGVGFGTLGNWATVTSTGGLGGGANFSYVGNTLSVIPEPSTWALLAVGMTAAVIFRRRRQL